VKKTLLLLAATLIALSVTTATVSAYPLPLCPPDRFCQ